MITDFFSQIGMFVIKLVKFVLQLAFLGLMGFMGWFFVQQTGILPIGVPISGASMLPTLPEQGFVMFKRYPQFEQLRPKLGRGDIVVFGNAETADALDKQQKVGGGFVKRIVAIPGDTVSIRDGFVYVNDTFVQEPYTFKPHSTFGGTAVQDCQVVKVPEEKVFVLGDNRKVSMDSRQIGLISNEDIQFYIPYADQEKRFASKWRDASRDQEAEQTSTFEIRTYLNLLNEERAKNGVKPLLLQAKLNESARLRAEVMLKYNDLSFEATRSGYTMQQALTQVGYSNSIYGEFPVLGYYDAQELFDAFVEQPQTKDFLLNKEYEEMGISTFVGELNGCPVQILVQHFAGYKPPNYPPHVIESWQQALTTLREVQQSWIKVRENQGFYEQHRPDVDRINDIISIRITRLETIVKRMNENTWLSAEEKKWMDQDEVLNKEQNEIARRLNAR